jgi:transcriptional regulator with XRE-family HTH domain
VKELDERVRIAKNIERYLEYAHKKPPTIAKEIGVNKSLIYEYVSGQTLPGVLILKKLCKALDCTYEDILGPIE